MSSQSMVGTKTGQLAPRTREIITRWNAPSSLQLCEPAGLHCESSSKFFKKTAFCSDQDPVRLLAAGPTAVDILVGVEGYMILVI